MILEKRRKLLHHLKISLESKFEAFTFFNSDYGKEYNEFFIVWSAGVEL